MAIRTVKVSNVSLGASEQDIKEFFSFSGEIEHIEMHSSNERSQIAYVVFKDPQGAETAILLSDSWDIVLSNDMGYDIETCIDNFFETMIYALLLEKKLCVHLCGSLTTEIYIGATIVDQSVTIDLDPDFKQPAATSASSHGAQSKNAGGAGSTVQKAEDVVSSMLAKGFVLGKDAVNKAKAFDEKHRFTSTATATVVSIDQKIGLSEKISAGTSLVNDKVREMDERFQVSGKTKSALSAAEQTVSNAGSAIMKNRYVLTGASWVTGAFNRVSKVAGEVSQKTREKVLAEEGEARKAEGYVQVHGSESPKAVK